MGLIRESNFRGIELPEQYLKVNSVLVNVSVFKDIKERTDNQILEVVNIHIPITADIYNAIKEKLGGEDELENAWQEEKEITEAKSED